MAIMAIRDTDPFLRLRRRTRALRGWAALGLLFVVFELYLFIAWFVSGDARPIPAGPDEVPRVMWVSLISLQVICVAAAVFTIAAVVVVPLRRNHRLSENGLWVLAFATLVWQEPLVSFVRPEIAYNAALVNLGSWTAWIPGWRSPSPDRLPVPLLLNGVAYVFMIFAVLLLGEWVVRVARRRWPNLGRGPILVILAAVFATFMLVVEGMVFARTGAYGWGGVVPSLTLWSGEAYQFPLYQLLMGTIWFTSFAALRLFSDDNGWTVVERGAESLDVGSKTRTAYRFFARVAACNLVFLLTYNVPMNLIGAHVEPWPPSIGGHSYFSYFTSQDTSSR
jgi:Spirocyclase AveC-like